MREEDKLGNAEADSAAGLGWRHQPESVMDGRRILRQVRTHWYPVAQQLHLFMIAVSRVSVNQDGRRGTAPDPLIWDQGVGTTSARWIFVFNLATLPGPPCFLREPSVSVHGGSIGGADVASWPYSVSLLCKFVSLWVLCIGLVEPRMWATLVFFLLEVMILFEQWAGHRLLSEKVIRPRDRAHRLISISSVLYRKELKSRLGMSLL